MKWNMPKEKKPCEVKDIDVSVLTCNEAKAVYVASPDLYEGKALKLDFKYVESEQGNRIKFIGPELNIWNLIYIIY